MSATQKPLVVAMAFPAPGHTNPLLQAVGHLASRGFAVWFVGAAEYEPAARAAGAARVFHILNPFVAHPNIMTEYLSSEIGIDRLNKGWQLIFLRDSGAYLDGLRHALEEARREEGGAERKIVILQEIMAGGALPMKFGAPLPRGYDALPPVVALHPAVLVTSSVDAAPFASALPPDSSPEGRERNKKLNAEYTAHFAETLDYMNKVFKELGCMREATGNPCDVWLQSWDVTLLLCSPSLEYPRSDQHPTIRFVGGLPLKKVDASALESLPAWFADEVVANSKKEGPERKKLVFVTQGTNEFDYNDLVLPTIRGLANREDVMVVATLGVRGGKLPDGVELPANARVVDYLPYDAVLPMTDVFVSNAGYGGFMHGVMNGVPMVLGGDNADKPEVMMRAEWAGVGVNLRTGHPDAQQVAAAVDKVLSDPSYKEKVVKARVENEAMDSLKRIEDVVLEFSQ